MVNGGKIIGQNSTIIFEPYHFRAAICTIVCFCQQEISCSLPTKDSIFVDKSSGGSRAYLCEFLHFKFWYPRWDSNPQAFRATDFESAMVAISSLGHKPSNTI